MRIGIDMLGAQSPTLRARGVGRYATQLVSSLMARDPSHEYLLYHHDGLPHDDVAANGGSAVKRRLDSTGAGRSPALATDTLVRTNPDGLDLLLLAAPWEGPGGFALPPKPLGKLKLASLVYDLVACLFPQRYLTDPAAATHYRRALRHLQRYDLVLACSEQTGADCRELLGLGAQQVAVIGMAGNRQFFRPDWSQPVPAAARGTLLRLGLAKPFVLGLALTPARQGFADAVAAFTALPAPLREAHQLVLACGAEDEPRRWLSELVPRHNLDQTAVLIDFSDAEAMRVLYQRCSALIWPAPDERFGVPLIEAMLCGAPVIAASDALAEVVGDAGLITGGEAGRLSAEMVRLLSEPALAAGLRQKAPVQAQKFTWEAAAERALAAMRLLARPVGFGWSRGVAVPPPKPRIAFFAPLPPTPSGIADYSQRLLAALRRHYTIDLYHDAGYLPHMGLGRVEFACHDYRLFPCYHRALDYHEIIYQMGNSEYHRFIYETLLRFPGLVVMHDLFLTHFHFGYALQHGVGPDHVLREMAACAPHMVEAYRTSRWQWAREPGGLPGACTRRGITLNRGILEHATVVVVHDAWGRARIAESYPEVADHVHVVPHGAAVDELSPARRSAIRARFNLADDALILASFGILHSQKCNVEAIEAFAAIAADYPQARLLMVGRDMSEGEAAAAAAKLGIGDRVQFLGHVSMETFLDLAAVTDIGINLRRPPTHGETSGALLTLLSAGVPTVVTDVDTFSSCPDDVVSKIRWNAAAVRTLEQALRELASDRSRRERIGRAAIEHVDRFHAWPKVAELYSDAIERSHRLRRPGGLRTAGACVSAGTLKL